MYVIARNKSCLPLHYCLLEATGKASQMSRWSCENGFWTRRHYTEDLCLQIFAKLRQQKIEIRLHRLEKKKLLLSLKTESLQRKSAEFAN